jgi:putative transposase
MTETVIAPQVGMRFELHGAEFEVAFIARGVVRYAATAGGRQYKMPLDDFDELTRKNTIQVKAESVRRTVHAENASALARKYRYVEAVLRKLPHPTARKALKAVIQQVAAELSDPSPPSDRAVIYWLCAYELGGEQGLVRKRGSGNHTLRFDPEVEQLIAEAIQQVHLTPERTNAKDVHSYVVGKLAESGLCTAFHTDIRVPTQRSIQRRLKQLDPYLVVRAQQGELAANRVVRAAGRTRRAESLLSVVEMDTHYLDILVVDPDTGEVIGRPYLTCLFDVCTRAVVGMYISLYPPSAATALAALQDMLTRPNRGLPGGVAVVIVPDNGVEFKNSAFNRVCEALAIVIAPAQIRDPNGKAHIERFFSTLTRGLVQKLSGTTFSSPVARGTYDSAKRANLTVSQLTGLIEHWVNEVYHQTVHSRTGRAPILAWEEQAKVIAPLSLSAEDVDALVRRPVMRTIQHGRVQVDGIEYFSHALATLQAQGVDRVAVLINDLNLHTVLIQHPDEKDTFISAESTDPEYTAGLNCYMHAESMRIKKAWSQADQKKLGQNANALARAQLLADIRSESQIGKKRLRKLTNGQGREANASQQQTKMAEAKPRGATPAPAPILDVPAPVLPSAETTNVVAAEVTDAPYTAFDLEW